MNNNEYQQLVARYTQTNIMMGRGQDVKRAERIAQAELIRKYGRMVCLRRFGF